MHQQTTKKPADIELIRAGGGSKIPPPKSLSAYPAFGAMQCIPGPLIPERRYPANWTSIVSTVSLQKGQPQRLIQITIFVSLSSTLPGIVVGEIP